MLWHAGASHCHINVPKLAVDGSLQGNYVVQGYHRSNLGMLLILLCSSSILSGKYNTTSGAISHTMIKDKLAAGRVVKKEERRLN